VRVVGKYSFAGGETFIMDTHRAELDEVMQAIASVDAATCRTKISREKTMSGRYLYAPKVINRFILEEFLYNLPDPWNTPDRVLELAYDIPDLGRRRVTLTTDGVKNKVGLEIQLGKYSFIEYDICAKLPIFKQYGRIECAIEVLPMNSFVRHMSTGPGWLERTATILQNRGFSELDVPVLLLGIDA